MCCIWIDAENFPSDYKLWVINTWCFVIFLFYFLKPKQEKISKLIMKFSHHNHFLLLYPTRVSTAHVSIAVLRCKVTLDYHLFILWRPDPSPTEAFGDIFPTAFNWLPSSPWLQEIPGNLLFFLLIKWWES